MKRIPFIFSLLGCLAFLLFSFTSCHKEIDYSHYLSENRRDIYIAEGEDYRLKIYAVAKEYPYCTDGFVGEISERVEVYFSIQNGGESCHILLDAEGVKLEGEMSYDGVQGEYYFSTAAHLGNANAIQVSLQKGNRHLSLEALSVKDADTLSSYQILNSLLEKEGQLFADMTIENEFAGEIYIRLIYESAPYYYVGVIGRDKKTTAFLLDAVSGKVLATKRN